MRRVATIRFVSITVILIVVIALLLAAPSRSPRYVEGKTPDGRPARIEEYHFQNTRLDYHVPALAPWERQVLRLSKSLAARFGISETDHYVVTPDFKGEAKLSGVFSWQADKSFRRFPSSIRMALADEMGNEFDPGVHDTMLSGNRDNYYRVGEAAAFPRRGKEVHIRLISQANLIAEYTIPNPAPGPYPDWKALPLPIKLSQGDLEATLLEFSAHQFGLDKYTNQSFSHTEFIFQFRQNDRPAPDWKPVGFEVFDATGNHWSPYMSDRYAGVTGDSIKCGFLGALWPGESAWKIRVQVQRENGPSGAETRVFDFLAKPEQVK